MMEITEYTELKLTFNFTKTFDALKSFIDDYNRKNPALKDKINASHRATAELIIRLYLKQLNKLTAAVKYSLVEMPSFRTYVSSLASCKDCTARTIYNHKERLIRAGLISCEKHHAGDGIDLWINPEIMWKGAYSVSKLEEGGTSLTPVYNHIEFNRKKVQPLVQELQEHNNINSNVDSEKGVRKPDKSGVPKGDAETRAFDKSTRKNALILDQKTAKEAVGTALNLGLSKKNELETTQVPGKMPQPQSPTKTEKQEQQAGGAARIFHLELVRGLWQYAKKALYPEQTFKDYQEKSILNSIWCSVYGGFKAEYTDQQWEDYHESCLVRIRMVSDYLKRSPHRWIAPAELYFCPYNTKNGFNKTWKWYVKQETLKLQVSNEIKLRQMKSELNQHGQGKGKYRHLSRYELFVKHRKQLDRLNDQLITQAYLAAYKRHTHA